jgi:hypothetical protein
LKDLVKDRVKGFVALVGLASMASAGCDRGAGASTYAVSVVVEADPSKPVASASIVRDGTALGTTGADGKATVRLRGAEGDVAAVGVRCPADYAAVGAPLEIPLHRLADPTSVPTYRFVCSPETRTLVVAVRATNGPNLPVLYLGKEVGRTDSSGAAHVELHLRPGERFELTLGTNEPNAARLMPQNPSLVFVAKDQDDLLFFDQRFNLEKPKAATATGPKPF